jgi:hypothetical protein
VAGLLHVKSVARARVLCLRTRLRRRGAGAQGVAA